MTEKRRIAEKEILVQEMYEKDSLTVTQNSNPHFCSLELYSEEVI